MAWTYVSCKISLKFWQNLEIFPENKSPQGLANTGRTMRMSPKPFFRPNSFKRVARSVMFKEVLKVWFSSCLSSPSIIYDYLGYEEQKNTLRLCLIEILKASANASLRIYTIECKTSVNFTLPSSCSFWKVFVGVLHQSYHDHNKISYQYYMMAFCEGEFCKHYNI